MRNNLRSFFDGLYLDAYLIDIWDDNNLLASFIMNPISEITVKDNKVNIYDDSENMIVITCDDDTQLIRKEDRIIIQSGTKEYSFIPI